MVVGELDSSRYCRACKALGAGVLFVGPQYGVTLAELYAGAALVVQPSVLEGMSLVLLEAAAHGRCILAADIRENRSVFGDSILYFSKDRIDELIREMRRSLSEDSLREDLGRKANAQVAREYAWAHAASAMEELYNRVVRGRRR